jgi:hypothetical protein
MPDQRAVITGPPPEGWVAEQERRSFPCLEPARHQGRGGCARKQLAKRRQVEHRIQTADGRIAEANSYGNDRRRIPG